MRLSILSFAALLIASQISAAAIVPPEGWSQEMMGEVVVMASPGANEGDHVVSIVRPAEPFSGSFEAWFTRRLSVLAPKLGKVTKDSGVSQQQGVFLDIVGMQLDEGDQVRSYFFGYAAGDKGQILLVMIPQAIDNGDPRVVAALDQVRTLVHSHFVLEGKSVTGASPAAISATAGGTMGPGQGFGEGLTGVYFGIGRRYALTPGTGLQGMNDVRLIVVLPDGKWRENLPGRGLETDIAADRRDFDRWGVWTASGGVVKATAQNDTVVLDAQNWTKLSPVHGLRSDGVFVVENSGWKAEVNLSLFYASMAPSRTGRVCRTWWGRRWTSTECPNTLPSNRRTTCCSRATENTNFATSV